MVVEIDVNKFKKHLKENHFVIEDSILNIICASIKRGYPILASGPTGCGKTHFFELLSKFIDAHYEYQSLNGSVTIQDLVQERTLDKDGSFTEKDMVLARWLRPKGVSILQLDEVNAARPETLMALHPIMDIKGELVLPYSEEVLKVDKDKILVMSCNEGDDYFGINPMNAAFKNRYIKVHFDYISGQELVKVLIAKTGVKEEIAHGITKTWEKYMSSRSSDQPPISIRMLERWCELSHDVGVKEAGIYCFANLIADNKEDVQVFIESDLWVNLP